MNNVTIGANTYESRGPGLMSLSTRSYSDPMDGFTISPGRLIKGGLLQFRVERVVEKRVTTPSGLSPRFMRVSCLVTVPAAGDFSPAEIDVATDAVAFFLSPSNISAIAEGDS